VIYFMNKQLRGSKLGITRLVLQVLGLPH